MASGILFDPSVLTLGFARRIAMYKRPTLLLQDIERLKRIVNNTWHPVQIIFAGKAHQDDLQSKQLLQNVFNIAKDQAFGGRIAFVEDYDELLAQYLVHGVDVWVNNPLPPMEASGTSGMKAGINGVPQLSILDGWWTEGYNGLNGWAFEGAQGPDRDHKDATAIYEILEKHVVPLYYDVDDHGTPRGWVKMMKETIKSTGPHFCARRMAKEYTDKFYQKALDAAMAAPHRGVKRDLFDRI
jgi:starch phosphorylase